jgi:hypothetical protein
MLFFASTLLCLAALVYRARRVDLTDLFLLVAFGWLGLGAIRGTIWFGLVMAPILARYLAAIPLQSDVYDLTWLTARFRREKNPSAAPPRPTLVSAILNLTLLAVLAFGAALSLPWFDIRAIVPANLRGNLTLISSDTPVGAGDYLARQASGARIFHTEAYGSYFDWRLYEVRPGPGGGTPVFVDTRLELYPASVWYDYLAVGYARYDWEPLLAKYHVDTLVLDKERLADLAAVAGSSPNWVRVYEDDITVIYRRAGGGYE